MTTQLFRSLLGSLLLSNLLFILHGQEENFFGMVLLKDGEVLLTRGIMEFPAKIEDSLQYGDELETGENGRVQLSFNSSFLSIGPNSYFSIEKEQEDGLITTILELEKGSIRCRIIDLNPDERFHVKTETGTIVVTGTDFVTSVGENKNMTVSVIHGSINMVPSEGGAPQPVGTMQTLGGEAGGALNTVPLGDTQVSQIKKELPVPTDGTESMQLLPDQGGGVSIDLVAIDTIAQGLDPVAGIAEATQAVQNALVSNSSEVNTIIVEEINNSVGNNPPVNPNDPTLPPGDVQIGPPGFDPPKVIDGFPATPPTGTIDGTPIPPPSN